MNTALITPAATSEDRDSGNFGLKVADAVWIGTALLHYSRPAQSQFSNDEIVDSVLKHRLTKASEKSIRQHVLQHCVADLKPQPNRSRMLHATREGHRRIFHEWEDRCHPAREGARTHPAWENLPKEFAYLQPWYEAERKKNSLGFSTQDPLLDLIGTGRGMWDGKNADDYIASLREGWDHPA